MAKCRLMALSLVLFFSCFGGAARCFTLLSEDEAAALSPYRGSGLVLAAGPEGTIGGDPGRISREQPSYTVEPVFSREFPKVVARDVVYAASAPFRWDKKDWLILGAGTALVAATSLGDTHIRNQIRHLQNSSATSVAEQIRDFGGAYSIAVLGLFLAGGEMFDKPVARAVFMDGAAASLITAGVTLGLKYAVGRARPSADKGNAFYQPFSSSGQSFPSGETAQAFAVASVIASHYDELWIKIASYGVATLVGMSRMYLDAHWLSGATAGALIGTAVGISIAHFNDKRRSGAAKQTRFIITPLIAGNATGVGMVLIY